MKNLIILFSYRWFYINYVKQLKRKRVVQKKIESWHKSQIKIQF